MYVVSVSGCSGADIRGNSAYLTSLDANDCPYEDFIVVDVFDFSANYQGIQSGWFGEVVRRKFNMELNIIAPNIARGGDTLFEVRAAAGNLGDLIICKGVNGQLEDLVNAGLLYDMEADLQDKPIMRYADAIENLNSCVHQGGVYAIPSQVSVNGSNVPSEGIEPVYGPYIRWDLYKELGYPEIDTIEDLLPVLKQMQERHPTRGEDIWLFFLQGLGRQYDECRQAALLHVRVRRVRGGAGKGGRLGLPEHHRRRFRVRAHAELLL